MKFSNLKGTLKEKIGGVMEGMREIKNMIVGNVRCEGNP